jgi:uncharacterized Tic20 family protein
MSLTDELAKLQQLRDSGAIDENEFASAKAKLLNEQNPVSGPSHCAHCGTPVTTTDRCPNCGASLTLSGDELERQTRQWAFLLHLGQFAGYIAPVAGFVVPVVIWQLKKDELPGLDQHGKNALNWIISSVIYAIISVLLCLILIGFPMLAVLLVCDIVFPILAAVKANNGETWKYPGAIQFVK